MTSWLLAVALFAVRPAASSPDGAFERDRAAILAMAGRYQVSFNFNETVALAAGYTLAEPQRSQGTELVLVIVDSGRVIELQHVLVVAGRQAVKHWRQRWEYEPTELLEFRGRRTFVRRGITPDEARGAWAQSVFEVDDAPRYQAVGRWRHDAGASAWESGETWRPLPRREYTKRSDYQVIAGRNRHALTPSGWVHEQDNLKLRLDSGDTRARAREAGLNRYERAPERRSAAVEAYWQATRDLWREVREAWRVATARAAIVVDDQDAAGRPRYSRLLELADALAAGGRAPERARLDALVAGFVHTLPVTTAGTRP